MFSQPTRPDPASRPSRLLWLPLLVLVGCSAPPPDTLGPRGDRLSPCPETPNCVNTGDRHPEGTEGIALVDDRPETLARVVEVVADLPRTRVVEASEVYLHAESRSRIFRFVDDLELLLVPGGELIVRSASRMGRGDLGVNARRVEDLRARLGEAGLLRSP